MTELNEAAIRAYSSVNPRDLRDAAFYVNKTTLEQLCRENNINPEKMPLTGNRMFGLPIFLDPGLPDGTVECLAETEMDRVIRRATEAGRMINVYRPIYSPPTYPAPAAPTLKALLRHWFRKVKR